MMCSVSYPNGDFQAHEDIETKDVAKTVRMDRADVAVVAIYLPGRTFCQRQGSPLFVLLETPRRVSGFTARSV
ncbi:hypothetical protein C5Y96_09955 [Blastopirellula marina]|uniref:Uncharacterized protein n=1 Tax=Blastopirellula marina TaxID=124 RepID=A0A2S8FLX8_9BACT|nr:hypothetical protein C5Y96_09955 [Blastopirellula marina]RCS52262.1 hypothetical protein DTL36_09965 [Bremerella cremea]